MISEYKNTDHRGDRRTHLKKWSVARMKPRETDLFSDPHESQESTSIPSPKPGLFVLLYNHKGNSKLSNRIQTLQTVSNQMYLDIEHIYQSCRVGSEI